MWIRLLALARLIRLPNVFTAPADVLAGYWLFVGLAGPRFPASLFWAAVGSALLYAAGIVFNDLYDLELDRRERPERPLPSGLVPTPAAMFVASVALASGVAAVAAAGPMAATAAWLLAVLMLLYNWVLKTKAAGPVAMGACRAVNVQIGMAVGMAAAQAEPAAGKWVAIPAIANGLYIAGVSVLARDEVAATHRNNVGLGVVLIAMGLALHSVVWMGAEAPYAGAAVGLLLIYAGWLAYALIRTFEAPEPAAVQSVVRTSILGLILVDAAVAAAFAGPLAAALVLLLLLPAVYLGRWLPST